MDNFTISIIGSSATGKSCLGNLLSLNTNVKVFDVDRLVSDHFGENIDNIFAKYGTEKFQLLSYRIMKNLYSHKPKKNMALIIGASSIQNKQIRNLIKNNSSIVVALRADPSILVKRIQRAKLTKAHAAHPLVAFDNGIKFSNIFFEFREPFIYFADEVINTDKLSIKEVYHSVNKIMSNVCKYKL